MSSLHRQCRCPASIGSALDVSQFGNDQSHQSEWDMDPLEWRIQSRSSNKESCTLTTFIRQDLNDLHRWKHAHLSQPEFSQAEQIGSSIWNHYHDCRICTKLYHRNRPTPAHRMVPVTSVFIMGLDITSALELSYRHTASIPSQECFFSYAEDNLHMHHWKT